MSIGAVIFGIVGIILIGMLYLGVGFKAITREPTQPTQPTQSTQPLVPDPGETSSTGGLRRRHYRRARHHGRRIKYKKL